MIRLKAPEITRRFMMNAALHHIYMRFESKVLENSDIHKYESRESCYKPD